MHLLRSRSSGYSSPRRLRPLYVLALIGALVAGTTLGPATVSAANTAISNVFVTNTAANPVPVAGSVTIGNLPATQAVSGTVGITGTTEVIYFSSGTIRHGSADFVIPLGTDVSAYKSVAVYVNASGVAGATSCLISGSAPEAQGAQWLLSTFTVPGAPGAGIHTFDPAPPTIDSQCLNTNTSDITYDVMVTGRSN